MLHVKLVVLVWCSCSMVELFVMLVTWWNDRTVRKKECNKKLRRFVLVQCMYWGWSPHGERMKCLGITSSFVRLLAYLVNFWVQFHEARILRSDKQALKGDRFGTIFRCEHFNVFCVGTRSVLSGQPFVSRMFPESLLSDTIKLEVSSWQVQKSDSKCVAGLRRLQSCGFFWCYNKDSMVKYEKWGCPVRCYLSFWDFWEFSQQVKCALSWYMRCHFWMMKYRTLFRMSFHAFIFWWGFPETCNMFLRIEEWLSVDQLTCCLLCMEVCIVCTVHKFSNV